MSDRTESKAFIRPFVREVAVAPGEATIRYALPLPAGNRHTGSWLSYLGERELGVGATVVCGALQQQAKTSP